MMVVRAIPVTSWMRCTLTPAAMASRIASSRRELARAQARSSVSTACGEPAGPRLALLCGAAARRVRGAMRRAGRRGASRSGSCRRAATAGGRQVTVATAQGWGPGWNVRAAWRPFSSWLLQQPAGSYPCSISHAVISCWAPRMDSASTPTAMAVPSEKTIRQVTSRCGRLSRTSMGLVVVSTVVTSWASLSTRAAMPGEG